jgi:hypothetical protein
MQKGITTKAMLEGRDTIPPTIFQKTEKEKATR